MNWLYRYVFRGIGLLFVLSVIGIFIIEYRAFRDRQHPAPHASPQVAPPHVRRAS